MDLNKINDIEILKKMIKHFLAECKQDYTYNNFQFNKGESYYIDQDQDGGIIVYSFSENGIGDRIAILDNKTLDKIF